MSEDLLEEACQLLEYMYEGGAFPCLLDHNGYCQTHKGGFREGGCWNVAVGEFLERAKERRGG